MTNEISSYITKRYRYWKDYARYYASLAGIPDYAEDLLHTVMISLAGKDPDQLRKLYLSRKGQYRELDFFVLNMVKRNACSPTSPFRYRVVDRVPKDSNADPWALEIQDDEYDFFPTTSERILDGMRLLRASIEWTYLQPFERSIMELRFFHEEPVTRASQLLKISYNQGRIYYHSGLEKVRETAGHIRELRKIHQN